MSNLNGNNYLHNAALRNCLNTVNELFVQDHYMAKELNDEGYTPLHLAIQKDRREIVKQLLSMPDYAELCLLRDRDGYMPIHTAVLKGRIEIVELLYRTCKGSAKELTYRNETVFHLAVRSKSFRVIEFCIKEMSSDGSLLNAKNSGGDTCLHLAVIAKQIKAVELLARTAGVDLNGLNSKNKTPLDALFESEENNNELAIVQILLSEKKPKEEQNPSPEPNKPIPAAPEKQTRPTYPNYLCGVCQKLLLFYEILSQIMSPRNGTTDSETVRTGAELVVGIASQALLNHLGLMSDDSGSYLAPHLVVFFKLQVVAFLTSLCVMLLMTSVTQKNVLKLLKALVWLSVFSTALGHLLPMFRVFPVGDHPVLLACFWALKMASMLVGFHFVMYLLGWVKRNKVMKRSEAMHRVQGIVAVIAGFAVFATIFYFWSFVVPAWRMYSESSPIVIPLYNRVSLDFHGLKIELAKPPQNSWSSIDYLVPT